ncbi:MAG TPA: hypothetical protein VK488_03985 [Gaiellaceae bacterium]|nr:hypothetical protein [Gaiellaceae bacterium]
MDIVAVDGLNRLAHLVQRPEQTLYRLRALDADPRFRSEYLVDRRCLLALPLYFPQVAAWPDAAYAAGARLGYGSDRADAWALAGGRADLRAGFVRLSPGDERTLNRAALSLTHAAARRAEREDRRLAALYVDERDQLLRAAMYRAGLTRAITLGSRAILAHVGRTADEYLRGLKARRRSIVRRDLRDLKRANVRAEVVAWDEVISFAAPSVADIHNRHGEVDHPLLVQDRLEQWSENPDVVTIAFAVRAGRKLVGASFAWVNDTALEMYELALPGVRSHTRRLLYLELLFYGPLRFCWEHELSQLDLALEASEPKALRGAALERVLGLTHPAVES